MCIFTQLSFFTPKEDVLYTLGEFHLFGLRNISSLQRSFELDSTIGPVPSSPLRCIWESEEPVLWIFIRGAASVVEGDCGGDKALRVTVVQPASFFRGSHSTI